MSLLATAINTTATISTLAFQPPPSKPKTIPGTEDKMALVLSWTQYASYILLGISLVIFFGRMGMQKRRGGEIEMDGLGYILLGVIGVGVALSVVTTLANA